MKVYLVMEEDGPCLAVYRDMDHAEARVGNEGSYAYVQEMEIIESPLKRIDRSERC